MADVFAVASPRVGDMVLDRRLDAVPSRVWEAWVRPDQLAQWFGPAGVHVAPETVVIEERVGGRWEFDMVADADGTLYPWHARLAAVAKPGYLEGRVAADSDAQLSADVSVRVWLRDVDGHTLLSILQGPLSEAQRVQNRAGWTSSLGRLDTLLAAG